MSWRLTRQFKSLKPLWGPLPNSGLEEVCIFPCLYAGGQTQKSAARCSLFVTLMIIYNSQVVCLCGLNSAGYSLGTLVAMHFWQTMRQKISKKKKVNEREELEIRQDLYRCRIISDDIALTNTVPHHYVCLPADCQRGTVPQILTVGCACGSITKICRLICLPASGALS